MFCSICGNEMVRDQYDLNQWKCKKCGFDATCRKCGLNPVHPHRKWQLCLDCILDILEEEGSINLNAKWKEKRNDWKSNPNITIINKKKFEMKGEDITKKKKGSEKDESKEHS